ncbi:MOP flippase family protein [uncultured Thiodictyon sp.]|jgi:PST family polysaccharide transporter|uniref:MOP flippase family protein n=1 Tax=uncultured Thiodictyon sp. TaxID=1846217 RepID=UPI0025E3BCBB|nr:MOP flippase family protein [uncultured Thiodictyon sp.]
MSLLLRIAKGAAWTAGAQWVVQLTQFATSIVLARMLSPSDYGLVGLALVYTGFVTLVANLGMGPALIQRRTIDDGHICAAFWGTAAVSVILFLFSVVAAPAVADFFNQPQLVAIVRVTAIAILFSPLNSILYSLLSRQMAFRSLALVDVAGAIASQGAALIFAVSGWGVWAIVIAQLANPLVRLLLLFRLNRWLPSWRFDPQRFAALFAFSSHLIGFNFVNYFARNLDKVIIGRFLGSAALGYYDMSYQIMLKPLQNVSQTISSPLLPALSSIQEEKAQASEVYRRVTTYIALITFPMMTGIALVAGDFVPIVLGNKWEPAVPIIRILCFVGAIQSVGSTVGDVYLSQGRSDIMLKWALATTPLFGAAFYLGTTWGIVGVAICYAAVNVPLWITAHHIANRLIGLEPTRFWRSLLPATVISLIMAAAVITTQMLCDFYNIDPRVRLGTAIATGVACCGLLLFVSSNQDIGAIRKRALEQLRPLLLRCRATR